MGKGNIFHIIEKNFNQKVIRVWENYWKVPLSNLLLDNIALWMSPRVWEIGKSTGLLVVVVQDRRIVSFLLSWDTVPSSGQHSQ